VSAAIFFVRMRGNNVPRATCFGVVSHRGVCLERPDWLLNIPSPARSDVDSENAGWHFLQKAIAECGACLHNWLIATFSSTVRRHLWRKRKATFARPRFPRHDSKMEFKMLKFTKRSSIVIAATLGIALSASLSFAALADTDAPPPATQSLAAAMLRAGDLVRVRSGGPLMTVTSVQGDQVNCSWTNWDGRLESQTFPVGALNLPLTMPRTDWRAARDAMAYYR
jgi:uncharacterized protein YodC (DUF2158 family)